MIVRSLFQGFFEQPPVAAVCERRRQRPEGCRGRAHDAALIQHGGGHAKGFQLRDD
jgi:hypothetical protein